MSGTISPDSTKRHEPLLTQIRGAVLVITLNRPQAKNAATLRMAELMAQALDRYEADDSLRAAVLTGAGGTFCAGMDLKAFVRGERPRVEGRGFLALTERPPSKPLIAAVEGHALAGGFETMLACDLVVAGRGARFGLPEVKRGLVAAAGGLMKLPRLTHRAVAMEMILTGDSYDAEFGLANGFVNRVVEDGQALDSALELAERIAANGPLALRASKRVIAESPEWPLREQFQWQREIVEPVFSSEDAEEGAKAFAEKRRPVWQGR
ncbi:crotonase/enoyl-CoA hydratase family protein [Micrococcus luteus]|uniref:crotonase/enoyl-CoA hydratase family protein n=1 Tax=Micrococcus luteus TaxID=1270 RepID=UPI003879C155